MYEFHAWFGLAESAGEEDTERLLPLVEELKGLLTKFQRPTASAQLIPLNGTYYLTLTGDANRRRGEADALEEILSFLSLRFPGAWGLVYERDDEMQGPPGRNAFRVRVLARGRVEERSDPFLSPCRPTIED
jgi:hypothetical protein